MATFGSFFHQGPICLNTRRVIVQPKTANEFLGKFSARTKTLSSGVPLDPKTIIGLLVIPAAVNYQPTILSNVPGNVAPANEETFGPVVAVEIVDTAEEAVQAANRTMYGLTGGERVRRASPTSQTSSGSTRVVENASFRSNEAPKDE